MSEQARRWLTLTLAAFALAAGVNTASVALQRRTGFLTRRFGRWGWRLHLALVLPPWGVALALLPGLGRRICWPLPRALRPLGLPLLAGAALLWWSAFRLLGAARTGNGDAFDVVNARPITGGIFRWLANPMYDSYVLALLGAALRTRNGVYALVAGELYLLLHQMEARVENRPYRAPAASRLGALPRPAAHDTLPPAVR